MTVRRLTHACAAVAVVLGGQLFAIGSATAALPRADDTSMQWSVQPSTSKGATGRNQFIFQNVPGAAIADSVSISNLSKTPLTFKIYPTDAFTTTDGSYALLPGLQPPTDLGTWVKLAGASYTLAPGKQLDVPFQLTVPKNASPGDHAGGIVASVSALQTSSAGERVNVDRRVAARIYLRVAGPISPAVEISAPELSFHGGNFLSGGTLSAHYVVRNTGNVRVSAGQSKLRVRGPLGLDLGESVAVNLPELLPGAQVDVTAHLDDVWRVGQISGSVSVSPISQDGALPTASRSASVWKAPWWLLGLFVLVVGVVLAVILVRRSRSRTAKAVAALGAQPALATAGARGEGGSAADVSDKRE